MLLRRLNHLGEELLEAPMICDDGETMAQEVLAPFFHGRRNREQLPDISR